MNALLETSHHLALAFAGPVLPANKSLILLVGDGYIAGYFFGSVFLPDVADIQGSPSDAPLADVDAKVEIWRRRWGVVVAFALAAIWIIGDLQRPASFPLAPADHDLFGAIPLVGVGGLIAALYAPVVARRLMKTSQKRLTYRAIEHRMGERFERVFGTVLAAVYVGVWLKPW